MFAEIADAEVGYDKDAETIYAGKRPQDLGAPTEESSAESDV